MASQALLKAVTSARLTQTRLLLQMGADVNVKDGQGQTPLMLAVSVTVARTRSTFLRLLLARGGVVSAADGRGRNAVMLACREGSLHDVSLLLRMADVDFNVNAQDHLGHTALWTAVEGNKVDIVQLLLTVLSQHQLDFEVADHAGVTPARLALKLGHLACLQVMANHLDSGIKSISTVSNMAKLNQILKCVRDSGCLNVAPDLLPQSFDSDKLSLQSAPTIRIISSEGEHIQTHIPSPRADNQQASDPAPLKQTLENLSRTSTPKSNEKPTQNPDSVLKPDKTQNRQTEPDIIKLPRVEDIPLIANGASTDNDLNQDTNSKKLKRSHSSPNLMDEGGEGEVLAPVTRGCSETSSVRSSLPVLFHVHSQQISQSFRKTAVEPPPPPPKPSPESPPPAPSKWSKLKGLALMGGLGKSGNSQPAGKAAGAGRRRSSDQGNVAAGGIAKVLAAKRRMMGAIKHKVE